MNNWNTFSFPLTNNLISDSSIHSALDKFNEEILSTLLDTQYMLIISQIKNIFFIWVELKQKII